MSLQVHILNLVRKSRNADALVNLYFSKLTSKGIVRVSLRPLGQHLTILISYSLIEDIVWSIKYFFVSLR